MSKSTESKGYGLYAFVGVAVIGIGALSFMSVGSDPEVEPAQVAAVTAAAAPQMAEPTPVPAPVIDTIVPPTPDVAAVETAPESLTNAAVVQDVESVVAGRVFTPSPIACVAGIEIKLGAIERANSNEASPDWSYRQMQVSELVQDIIDCPQAGFEIIGSLQLLELGLADLEITWDRDDAHLELKTVARAALDGVAPLMDQDESEDVDSATPWTKFTLR